MIDLFDEAVEETLALWHLRLLVSRWSRLILLAEHFVDLHFGLELGVLLELLEHGRGSLRGLRVVLLVRCVPFLLSSFLFGLLFSERYSLCLGRFFLLDLTLDAVEDTL